MLKLEQVHTHYGAVEALAGVSIEVNKGEIVTLIGSNGAGKTTLMMTVCGTPRASSGRVLFEGKDITAMSTHQIMRQGMAISPEGRRVFPSLTVLENLKMGGFFASRHEIDDGIEHVFKLFPRLKERATQRAGTMSGGEQQMLAIGRALMSKPRLLLLDEPTLGLAPLVIAQIFDIIRTIRDEGVTVFLVEQNANKALGGRSRLRARNGARGARRYGREPARERSHQAGVPRRLMPNAAGLQRPAARPLCFSCKAGSRPCLHPIRNVLFRTSRRCSAARLLSSVRMVIRCGGRSGSTIPATWLVRLPDTRSCSMRPTARPFAIHASTAGELALSSSIRCGIFAFFSAFSAVSRYGQPCSCTAIGSGASGLNFARRPTPDGSC